MTSFSSGGGGGEAADSKTEKNGFREEAGLNRSEKEGVEMEEEEEEERREAGGGCDPKKGFVGRVDEGGGGSWLRTGLKHEESLRFSSRLKIWKRRGKSGLIRTNVKELGQSKANKPGLNQKY